jgi:hypothetical protein
LGEGLKREKWSYQEAEKKLGYRGGLEPGISRHLRVLQQSSALVDQTTAAMMFFDYIFDLSLQAR